MTTSEHVRRWFAPVRPGLVLGAQYAYADHNSRCVSTIWPNLDRRLYRHATALLELVYPLSPGYHGIVRDRSSKFIDHAWRGRPFLCALLK